jgi:hypothetical protein
VWANTELFQLDGKLAPTAVAGCPPDAFSDDGQLWGNPLYRWEEMAKDGYGWWVRRLEAAGNLYDTVRLDHFRGFESYWAVPAGAKTAKGGKWIKGPDMDFIHTIKTALPKLDFIAEDLGYLTPAVLDLLKASESEVQAEEKAEYEELYKIALAAYCHLRSTYLQISFVMARDNGMNKAVMRSCVEEEMAVTKDLYNIVRNDSRIGFEASNHYYYTLNDLREKIISCESILKKI